MDKSGQAKKVIITIVMLVAGAFAFYQFHTSPFVRSEKNTPGGVLKWAYLVVANEITPLSNLVWNTWIAVHIFEGLVEYDNSEKKFKGLLAKSWQESADGLSWTIHLKQGVFFHDGTSFDADAVTFHINRLLHRDHPYYAQEVHIQLIQIIESVHSVNSHRVIFRLYHRTPYFLDLLAMHELRFMSPQSVRNWGDKIGLHPAGTGPFQLAEFIPRKKCVLKRNALYHDRPATIEYLEFYPVDAFNRKLYLELLAGSLDGFFNVQIPITEMQRISELQIFSEPSDCFNYYVLNVHKEPLSNKKVRQAIRYIFDPKVINDMFGYGLHDPAYSMLSDIYFTGEERERRQYSYDPQMAKKLLRESGQDGPFTLEFLGLGSASWIGRSEYYGFLKHALSELGIELTLTNASDDYFHLLRDGAFDITFIQEFSDYTNPLFTSYSLYSDFEDKTLLEKWWEITDTSPINPVLRQIILLLKRTTGRYSNAELIQLREKMWEESYLLPYNRIKNVAVVSNRVHNFALTREAGVYNFRDVWLEGN